MRMWMNEACQHHTWMKKKMKQAYVAFHYMPLLSDDVEIESLYMPHHLFIHFAFRMIDNKQLFNVISIACFVMCVYACFFLLQFFCVVLFFLISIIYLYVLCNIVSIAVVRSIKIWMHFLRLWWVYQIMLAQGWHKAGIRYRRNLKNCIWNSRRSSNRVEIIEHTGKMQCHIHSKQQQKLNKINREQNHLASRCAHKSHIQSNVTVYNITITLYHIEFN